MADKELMRLSREEIAKQFQLPERKSKIATLLKQDGQAYCICRSSDSSRFMIGCDSCEEWYHGDCIGLAEKEAKYIRRYFCMRCQDEDPNLETQFKPGVKADLEARFFSYSKIKRRKERKELADITSMHAASLKMSGDHHRRHHRDHHRDHHGHSQKEDKQLKHFLLFSKEFDRPRMPASLPSLPSSSSRREAVGMSKRSCGLCVNCYRTVDCGECRACRSGLGPSGPRRDVEMCLNRQCLKQVTKYYVSEKGGARTRVTHKPYNAGSGRRKRRDSSSDGGERADKPRQCLGPGCVNPVLPRSKYCSDACGIQLATNRIYQVLPQRIQEWAISPCVAEEMNKKELESVRKQQLEVRAILQELDKRHMELDSVLERAKNTSVVVNSEEDGDDETEMSTYCITCGHEIHSRTAIRHMERCFNKYESQASFGSIYKTRIEGNNMFCDFFNPSNKTYCKRLRVLCPEHCKDPKVSDTEVCGCPLVTNVFDLTGEFCRSSKKTCVRHYCWEKLRRAEIDMERVRQWLKIDELIEQERQIRQRMTDRAGVLALMLHSTYNHLIMEQMAAAAAVAAELEQQHHDRPSWQGNEVESSLNSRRLLLD